MRYKETGGPAFPVPDSTDDGMTLRDYFAAKAMQAIISGNLSSASNGDTSWTEADMWAPEIAYRVADVMLKARVK